MEQYPEVRPGPPAYAVDPPESGGPPVSGVPSEATGRTVIQEQAVAKVAAAAARSVPGVHSLGTAPSRALGAIRDAVGADHAAGVRAEVGETQAAVDVTLVAKYGVPLQKLADSVRAAVYLAVEELTGLTVIEVNVEIADVFIGESRPGDARQAEAPAAPRSAGPAGIEVL
ncbi:Asp23/Gls24 family envelope stress response protein [Sinomonas susongensis]|uniref:Asp23/Gls24 family envelope stress response protein n=1 Tax=Sinomonas susongensis TaxID=1324851 RepID=UPI00110809AF|nr:Asp23/Gls24 family envelope stress response protein [Sinomonas susongensis]